MDSERFFGRFPIDIRSDNTIVCVVSNVATDFIVFRRYYEGCEDKVFISLKHNEK